MLKEKSNKFIIGLIIVIIAVVALDVLVYAVYKGMSVQPGMSLKINSAKAKSMSIKTDKLNYAPGEEIAVTVVNASDRLIRENSGDVVTVNGAPNLGKNYGVALIEKYDNGGWLAIEPLWRCDAPCNEPCPKTQAIKPGETKIFIWDQTRKLCQNADKDIKTVNAGVGRYRISSAVLGLSGVYKMIHSKEFIIN